MPRTEERGRLQSLGSRSQTRLSDFTFTLSFPPSWCLRVHSLCLHLYSCPGDRFICTIFLGSTYAGQYIFVFLYDLLQSVEQTLGPSTSISFLQWLSNIPLYICTSLKSPQGQQCDVWKGGRKTLGWWVSELTFCLPYLPMAYAEL